jgi:cyclic beta-1,2-glucan synthetase
MGPAIAMGAALMVAALALRPSSWPIASAILVLWAMAPLAALEISLPAVSRIISPLAAEDARFLRAVARKTFRFFEAFVGPDDGHLPRQLPGDAASGGCAPHLADQHQLYLLDPVRARLRLDRRTRRPTGSRRRSRP